MDHIHTASNFNLKLFIICKDLAQESVHLSLHTLREGGPEQGGRNLVGEAPGSDTAAQSHTGEAEVGCERGLWSQSQP